MDKLKMVVLMLLSGEEVVISDDLNKYYTVKLEALPEGVDFAGDTTYIIRADKLKG